MSTLPSITLTPERGEAAAGKRTETVLTIANMSSIIDRFSVAVTGVPENWLTISASSVTLFPSDREHVTIAIEVPSGTDATAGDYPLAIAVTSEQDGTLRSSLDYVLTVKAAGTISLDLSPATVIGRRAEFHVLLRNDSNAPSALSVYTRDTEENLVFQPDVDGVVAIPAGEQRTVTVDVKPKRGETIGEPHLYELEIWALREGEPPTAKPDIALLRKATFTYTPRVTAASLPRWVRRLPGWLLLLLLLLLVLATLFAGSRTTVAQKPPPVAEALAQTTTVVPTPSPTVVPSLTPTRAPAPEIRSFALAAPKNGAVVMSWQTANAAQVLLNGAKVSASGKRTVQLGKPLTMVLQVSGPGGSLQKVLKIAPVQTAQGGVAKPEAEYLPVVQRFAAGLDAKTGSPVLAWQVGSASSVTIDAVKVPASGQKPLPASPGTHVLRATNKFGDIRLSLIVDPKARTHIVSRVALRPPSIDKFTISPVKNGAGMVVRWHTNGAHLVLLNGKRVGLAGSLPFPLPRNNQRLDLVADGGYLSSHARLLVHLTGGSQPKPQTLVLRLPRIDSFKLVPGHGPAQQVSWHVTGASRVTIAGKTVAPSGAMTTAPHATNLVLIAVNDVGTRQTILTVAGPSPTSTRTSTPSLTATRKPALTATALPSKTPTRQVKVNAPSPTRTHAPSKTPTTTRPTHTPVREATRTQTKVPTRTRARVPTHTPTRVPTHTPTRVPTHTQTRVPTHTPTTAPTAHVIGKPGRPTATATRKPSRTPTKSPTKAKPTRTRTKTPTRTPTRIPSHTPTAVPTFTPTSTPTSTFTAVPPTNTATSTATDTPTNTATDTPTSTSTSPPTPTMTPLASIQISPEPLVLKCANCFAAFISRRYVYTGTLTLTNLGPGPVSQVSASLSATTSFTIDATLCGPLAAGASCDVKVGYVSVRNCYPETAPEATLTISASPALGMPRTVPVSVAIQACTYLVATPTSLTLAPCSRLFISRCVGYSGSVAVTIQGVGPVTSIAGQFSDDLGFTVTATGASCDSLGPGLTCTVLVQYPDPAFGCGLRQTTMTIYGGGAANALDIPVSVTLPACIN